MGIGIVVEDKKQKTKFLVMVMNVSRSSGMSTYTTWLCFFDEGEGKSERIHGERLLGLLAVKVRSRKRVERWFILVRVSSYPPSLLRVRSSSCLLFTWARSMRGGRVCPQYY